MVNIEELAYLPREPKPINMDGTNYYEIFEPALIKIGISPWFIPVLSIGLQKVENFYSLLFSEVANQIRGNFIPSAFSPRSESLGNIFMYLSPEKLKQRY